MTLGKTLGVAAVTTAFALWPPRANAQEPTPAEEREVDPEQDVVELEPDGESDLEIALDVIDPTEDGASDALYTPFGALLEVSGGARGFVGAEATDFTGLGGYWDVRAIFGTRYVVGGELAYAGSAQDVLAIGLSEEAFLLSNGLEAAARLNVPITLSTEDVPILVEPYGFGGVGWQRYDVVNAGVNTSLVADQDDVLAVPIGVGIALGVGGVVLDGRFTYRQAFFSDLFGSPTSSFSGAALNQWQVGAGLGFEF